MTTRANPWQSGDPNTRISTAVDTASVIAIGDLIELNSDVPQSADDATWLTNIATSQALFVVDFGGVAVDASRAGDVAPLRYNTRGIHLFTCAAATFDVGDWVGPTKASGDNMENFKVVAVATEDLAIGRVARTYESNTTRLEVEIFGRTTAAPII